MNKLELSREGYERIMNKINAIEDTLNKGYFEPGAARRCLRETSGELYALRHILYEVCLLSPEAADPPDPNAA
ncbi:MAG: hypothetical protein LBO80_07175 [Treponema sp.]|jgi:hypothetical protein|nr:hypothetical protein [Treponema sp.]